MNEHLWIRLAFAYLFLVDTQCHVTTRKTMRDFIDLYPILKQPQLIVISLPFLYIAFYWNNNLSYVLAS